MFISHPVRLFLATALLLTSSIASADSVIKVDMGKMTKNDESRTRTAAATVSIDNDDLCNMSSFKFMGMGRRDAAAVYTKSKSTTRTLTDGSQEVVWEGALMDKGRVGFATLVQMANGFVAGTFTTETNTYSLVQMPDGTLQVQVKEWKDAMEGGSTHEEQREPLNHVKSAKPVSISAAMSVHPATHVTKSVSSQGEATAIQGPNRNLRRNLQANSVIDVLVIVTDRARCEHAGLSPGCAFTDSNTAAIASKIPVIESQTNTAMQGVDVAAEIRIVEVIYLAPGYDGRPNGNTLEDFERYPIIGQWRNEAGADLVAMITGDDPAGQAGGIAYLNSYQSVTSHTQLQFNAFTHEVRISGK